MPKCPKKKNVEKAVKKPVKDLIYQSSTDEAAPAAKECDIEMEDADIGDVSNLFAFDPMKSKKRQAERVKRMIDAGDDTDEGDFHVTNTKARRRRVNYAVMSEDSDEDEQDSVHIETEKQREASGHEDMPPEMSEEGMSRLDMQPSTDETSTRSPQIRIKEKKSHDISEMMLLDESEEGRLLVPFGDGENTVSSQEHNAEGQLSGDVEEEEDVGVGGSSSAEQTASDQSEGRSAAARGMVQKSRRRSGYVLNSDSDYDSV
ncbi:uncharacterized protein PAC_07418 [Phialocephala subalpina]|uniref:Uncharacterized protein n=1 Tax=Phialocephala subalpina TaxID=576137 RepID=A0A1L7WXQ4_9HELO|nr:uncharacterized protein PAC_07418 [Phialocephala subalpina]